MRPLGFDGQKTAACDLCPAAAFAASFTQARSQVPLARARYDLAACGRRDRLVARGEDGRAASVLSVLPGIRRALRRPARGWLAARPLAFQFGLRVSAGLGEGVDAFAAQANAERLRNVLSVLEALVRLAWTPDTLSCVVGFDAQEANTEWEAPRCRGVEVGGRRVALRGGAMERAFVIHRLRLSVGIEESERQSGVLTAAAGDIEGVAREAFSAAGAWALPTPVATDRGAVFSSTGPVVSLASVSFGCFNAASWPGVRVPSAPSAHERADAILRLAAAGHADAAGVMERFVGSAG